MSDGKDCKCYARYKNECACEGVDWTPQEVYDLRAKLKIATEALKELQKEFETNPNDYRWSLTRIGQALAEIEGEGKK